MYGGFKEKEKGEQVKEMMRKKMNIFQARSILMYNNLCTM